MKVLLVGPRDTCDYLASVLFDGFQELLGEDNVVDAVDSPWLHGSSLERLCRGAELPGVWAHPPVVRGLSGSREGRRLGEGSGGRPFDLLVVHSSFTREHAPGWAARWRGYLREGGKVAYVEGWDSAAQVVPPDPGLAPDAYFRKEVAAGASYPLPPRHLTFAAPSRWFAAGAETWGRPVDVFFSGNPDASLPGHEVRWPALGQVFRTRRTHRSVIASTGGFGYDAYLGLLGRSKLALCLPGADLTDSLRTMEAAACGAVPVFVGYPERVREPWFPNESCVSCGVDDLPEHLDEALAHDLAPRRRALLEHARKYHTTAARARQMLDALGMTP